MNLYEEFNCFISMLLVPLFFGHPPFKIRELSLLKS